MKRLILICLVALLGAQILGSCNNWLDVHPKERVLQKDLFDTPEGYRTALNGVYRLMSSQELWGQNLTWGMSSLLAQHYADDYGMNLTALQRRITNYEWQHADVQAITESMWKHAYFTLANINNLIQETENREASFFPRGEQEKNLILGEMLGLRALLHFEMLRLFAPSPAAGLDVPGVPYVASYPNRQPTRLPMAQVLTKAIDDMTKAAALLQPLDTEEFAQWMAKPETRFKSGQSLEGWGEFFNYRGVRLNYYAAQALLARMYQWQGNTQAAYDAAKTVYDAHKAGIFVWTPTGNLSATAPANLHHKRWNEILLAFYDQKAYDNYELMTRQALSPQWYPMFAVKNMAQLFGSETNDYRYSGLLRSNLYWVYRRSDQTTAAAVDIANYQGPLLTVVRFPEMYHIMIEHLIAKEEFGSAHTLSAELRLARGTNDSQIPGDNTDGAFTDFLVNDMVREGLTEGQVFFMFKRLNRDIFNGATNVAMTPAKFTPPYPNSETSYVIE